MTAKHGLAYCCLDDFSDLAPTSLNNALQILERLSSLRFDSTIDKCTSLGIEAEASRDEDKRWADDGLAIWPNGLGCICDTILLRHQNRDSTRLTLRGDFYEGRVCSDAGHVAYREWRIISVTLTYSESYHLRVLCRMETRSSTPGRVPVSRGQAALREHLCQLQSEALILRPSSIKFFSYLYILFFSV